MFAIFFNLLIFTYFLKYGHFAKTMNTSPASLMSTYKPLSFEPSIPENDETIIYSGKSECMLMNVALLYSLTYFKIFLYTDFKRCDVTDLTNYGDKLSCTLPCKYIRMGTYCIEPSEPVCVKSLQLNCSTINKPYYLLQVVITSRGIRIIAPAETNPSENVAVHIHKQEIVKAIANFSKSSSESLLSIYTLRTCAQYIRNSLKMPDITQPLDGGLFDLLENVLQYTITNDIFFLVTYFSPNGPYQMRKIIIQFQNLSDQIKNVLHTIFEFLDEISDIDAQELLQRAAESDHKVANNKNSSG